MLSPLVSPLLLSLSLSFVSSLLHLNLSLLVFSVLSGNQLVGTVPLTFANLSLLQEMYPHLLLPPSFASFPSLCSHRVLHGNNISVGCFPPRILNVSAFSASLQAITTVGICNQIICWFVPLSPSFPSCPLFLMSLCSNLTGISFCCASSPVPTVCKAAACTVCDPDVLTYPSSFSSSSPLALLPPSPLLLLRCSSVDCVPIGVRSSAHVWAIHPPNTSHVLVASGSPTSPPSTSLDVRLFLFHLLFPLPLLVLLYFLLTFLLMMPR